MSSEESEKYIGQRAPRRPGKPSVLVYLPVNKDADEQRRDAVQEQENRERLDLLRRESHEEASRLIWKALVEAALMYSHCMGDAQDAASFLCQEAESTSLVELLAQRQQPELPDAELLLRNWQGTDFLSLARNWGRIMSPLRYSSATGRDPLTHQLRPELVYRGSGWAAMRTAFAMVNAIASAEEAQTASTEAEAVQSFWWRGWYPANMAVL